MPASGRHPRLGFEVRLALGLLAGAAVGALLEPARPAPGMIAEHFHYTLDAKAESAFRAQTHLKNDGERLSAASRKLTAVAPIRAGERLDLHWSWGGVEAGTPGRDAPAPENLTPIGSRDPDRRTVLLHTGTLAEPIRACAKDWPGLSVAVIAANPWRYPADPDNNRAARQLAIQLLDSGAVDLAIIGPDWAAAARELANQWSFVPDPQWLFFSPLPLGEGSGERGDQAPPPLGNHRAQIQADYARLAAHLRERVQGVLDTQDPAERPPPPLAAISVLAGTPRLWGGPERETVRLADGTAMEFVTVCPGTFTMGADDLLRRRLPVIVAETLGVARDSLTPQTRLDAQTLGEETNARLRTALQERLGTSASDDNWKGVTDLRSAADAFKWLDQPDERPAHPVLMEGFRIARTETTQAQRQALLPAASAPGTDGRLPAANDDWDQARAACGALADGDLPTEAQWEYAARAASRSAWSWGDEPGAADAYAWSDGNSGAKDHPVGGKQPNPLGLADMHGNLWEWNRDCYRDTAYQERAGRLAADPLEYGGECRLRVVRGGSFALVPSYLRSARRDRSVPRLRDESLGFRCVRSGPRSLEHWSP
ncbi:formylglycine-generating enzyme family protein [uncultured Thiodictyon sp.]|uniref:formylglycine-generating enzyme family protein n=1 Tax=uncultured Thiodictyon sp. TaxID=1846217 RepID=UPI0025DE71E3|nr:formylglycine-generating enzyme family protein [uncultured Thiodictyon sp.]